MKLIHITLVAACVAVAVPAGGAVPLHYAITDLGTLGGTVSGAYGINDAGQVVGSSTTSGGAYHATLWSGGATIDLGTLGGGNSYALDINATGQVAGYSYLAGNASYHAFIHNGTTMLDIGTLGGTNSIAYAINDAGQVAGRADKQVLDIHGSPLDIGKAFLFQGVTMKDLGGPGGPDRDGSAYDVNSAGVAVGSGGGSVPGTTSYSTAVAFRYDGATTQSLGVQKIYSFAQAINDAGQIVGYAESSDSGYRQAFLYQGGVITDLGTLGGGAWLTSIANDINDDGLIVGESRIDNANLPHAFVHDGTTIADLNDLIDPLAGWTLYSAQAINSSGQIVGYGAYNGATRAFLLTPGSVVDTVPEPGVWAMMIAGFGALGAAGRRRRKGVAAVAC